MSARVGVLGGMGPAATVDFFAKVVAATPAETDQQHLHLLIDNDPTIPDRNAAFAGTGPSPGPHLAANALRLQRAGADFVVMVCNGAHGWADEVRAAIDIPLLHIVEQTVAATRTRLPGVQRVGVLATSNCLGQGLYQDGFATADVDVLHLAGDELDRFMDAMYRIKRGELQDTAATMAQLATGLIEAGAQAIVAGCTEVPLVLRDGDLAVPVISSTDALVQATIERALATRASAR